MRERPAPAQPRSGSRAAYSIDVVLLTPLDRELAVLVNRAGASARARETVTLPWSVPRAGESLEDAARRIVRVYTGEDPAWLDQSGTFAGEGRHPSGSGLSVSFVAVTTAANARSVKAPASWVGAGAAAAVLTERQAQILGQAMVSVRNKMDYAPIPFRLLPSLFTLSELQQVYEILLGRKLHKASFRRALHASWLVEPTDEWRGEGRGRPAQLFRFAPRRRRGNRRGVRFDLL